MESPITEPANIPSTDQPVIGLLPSPARVPSNHTSSPNFDEDGGDLQGSPRSSFMAHENSGAVQQKLIKADCISKPTYSRLESWKTFRYEDYQLEKKPVRIDRGRLLKNEYRDVVEKKKVGNLSNGTMHDEKSSARINELRTERGSTVHNEKGSARINESRTERGSTAAINGGNGHEKQVKRGSSSVNDCKMGDGELVQGIRKTRDRTVSTHDQQRQNKGGDDGKKVLALVQSRAGRLSSCWCGPGGSTKAVIDYVHRGQWLRAAILGANDGLVSTASLMIGVGAIKDNDGKAHMVVSGLAGLVGGACSMAIGEFVSVYSQRDAERKASQHAAENFQGASKKGDIEKGLKIGGDEGILRGVSPSPNPRSKEVQLGAKGGDDEEKDDVGPSPWEAAGASSLSFALGAMVPLLSGSFINDQFTRLGVMMGVCTVALICMGAISTKLAGGNVIKGTGRVVMGAWLAMLLTFGVLRLFGSSGAETY